MVHPIARGERPHNRKQHADVTTFFSRVAAHHPCTTMRAVLGEGKAGGGDPGQAVSKRVGRER